MYNLLKEPNIIRVEVYTLGSGKGWRNMGKNIDKDPGLFTTRRGVCVDGCVYWELQDGQIVAFDLADENFVELPKYSFTDWDFKLVVWGGYLSAIHYDKDSKTFDILLLKKKEDGSLGWIKEFSLSDMDTQDSIVLDILFVTPRGTILCKSKTKVHIYDPNSSSLKILVDFEDKAIFQAIPYINTLVSLKALGEENTKTMESADVSREVVEEYMSGYGKELAGVDLMCMQQ